jgi:long-subunit acyl-CoA synthetase (AMP-forming)
MRDRLAPPPPNAAGGLHSGDLASMDDDGAMFIVDRKKE